MFPPINYNPLLEKIKKIHNTKSSKSVDKMISKKKINISKMEQELSLLNSDIEDLYKKYAEKKKIRRNKEKSEQHLVSHINYLIDEERKIRTQIENNPIQKDNDNKYNKSLKNFTTPESITNLGTIRYKTIESNDDNHRSGLYKFKHYSKRKENLWNKKNNNSTISSGNSIQNNSVENLSNNNDTDTANKRSNVTNNVCIIINNTEQNRPIQNTLKKNKNNYYQEEVSFGKKGINNINTNDLCDMNISTGEKDKRKINIEIQNIKMKLANNIEENEIISEKDNNISKSEKIEDSLTNPSFNSKIRLGKNKNGIRSLKNILNMKRKYLKNLNKEIDLRRININIKKRSVENKNNKNKLFNTNLKSENYYDRNTYKKTSKDKDSLTNKKNYSKPNYNNINKNRNKSQLSNKISINSDINNNISIDSSEVNLPNTYNNYNNNLITPENKIVNNNYQKDLNLKIKKPKNIIEKINDIKKNRNASIPLSNLTFNQSIENKRKMLGIGINKNNDKNNNYTKNLKYKTKLKKPEKNKLIDNDEDIISSNNEDINNNLNTYDVLSYASISNVSNPIENNNINKNNNKYIQNNFSLMSLFSNKSNKTSIPSKVIKKVYDDDIVNDNEDAHITKIRNIFNKDIIIKKQEKNKNYVNSIRIIKKREKNNVKENNNPINCVDTNNNQTKKDLKEIKDKKPKVYNNEITITKELAAIRRINMKIAEYKNNKPQIKMISERRKNRFQEEKKIEVDTDNKINNNNKNDNNSVNKNNNNKSKDYRFQSYRRLSEIQKRTNNALSSNKNNNMNKRTRSKSNKNMKTLHNNNIRFFKP